jgi:hypothetical protein
MFFKSSAVAGANLFGCTSTNIWTALNAQEPEESVIAPTSGSGSAYAPTTNCPQFLAFLQIYDFVPDVANTVISPTLNICGLGALPIIHNDSTNLTVGELQPGHVYPLVVNPGVTAFLINWEQLQPDGSQSIQVTRVGNLATVGYRPAVVPDKINTQTLTNFWDFSGAALRPPRSTVASLPAASANSGKLIEVTDGASLCDATIGGGSTVVAAISNGTSWIAPNCLPATVITTVANLPSASANSGKLVEVTDGASQCDVTVGGGSIVVMAISNGIAWIAPNCGVTLAGNNSWTGNNDFTASPSVSLPAPWVSTAVSNIYVAGAKQVFPPSATTAGARIVCGSNPSALAGGDYGCTPAGLWWHFDGSVPEYHVTNQTLSSGSGNLPQWSGTSGTLLTDSGVAVSAVAVRVSVPGSSTATCTVGQYAVSSTFHYDCIATNTWVRSTAVTW